MNKAVLGGVAEDDTTTSKFAASINQLIGNKEMYLVLAAFLLTMLVVYLIRRMSIDHAWTIAIVVGILMEFSILFTGYMFLAISGKTIALTVGSAVSALIAFALKFLFFHVDYMRTERVQFEDDEYYYYVKAVPKISVTQSKKQVKKFAGKLGCIIAVTGAIDLVADADTCYVIRNGRPEMGKITGTGCQLSGLMTAYLTANPDNKLEAADGSCRRSRICEYGVYRWQFNL